MNPSPLQLEGYYLTDLSFQASLDHHSAGGETKIWAEDLESAVWYENKGHGKWRVVLRVELPSTSEHRGPYSFKVGLIGFFELASDYRGGNAEQLVKINGPSMLYSAAREALASVTGRGPFPPVLLPSVNFLTVPGDQRRIDTSGSMRSEPAEAFPFEYGFSQRREEFGIRYIRLLKSIANMKTAWDLLLKEDIRGDRLIMYGLGRIAFEDEFTAIVLLCANGYSPTARIILRALFEKVVDLLYLNRHPEKMKAFTEFSWVDRGKQVKRIAPILSRHGTKRTAATQSEIEAKHKKLRPQYSPKGWAGKTLVEKAKEVGIPDSFTELAYYGGIAEAHPKPIAIYQRISERTDGSLWWRDELPSLDDSRVTLMLAHYFILKAVEVLHKYFGITGSEEIISQCAKDYFESWDLSPAVRDQKAPE
jgi:preprotein translocase subunit SecB